MTPARHALLIALVASVASASAEDTSGSSPSAPVVVPTPTFGNDTNGANMPPPTMAPDLAPESPPPSPPGAESPELPTEAAIPQAYRDDRYQVTKGKNPFLLKTKTAEAPAASFAQDWELKFLREYKGVIKAGIQNRQTQQYRNIGPEPDSEGFKIVNAKIGRNRKDSSVEVAKGSETATLTYSDAVTPAGGRPQGGGIVPGQQRPQPVPQGAQAGMPQGYRPTAVPGAATGAARLPNGVPVPGQQHSGYGSQPPGVVPGSTNQAPPNPINRRRVLIPAPTPAAQ